jgi:iduronate 2-sulfatase
MRRRFILLGFLGVMLLSGSATASASTSDARMNVLVILVDDLRADFLSCYGSETAVSPNIERLAEGGLVFDQAYAQKALCYPSRNSLLSGLMPSALKSVGPTHHQTFRIDYPEITALPQLFKQNGYYTRGLGKVLHNGQDDPVSWSEPALHVKESGVGRHTTKNNVLFEGGDVEDEGYQDGRTAMAARQAIRTAAEKKEPFFMMVGFYRPHTPFNCPKTYWDLYDRESIPLAAQPNAPAGSPTQYSLWNWNYVRSFHGIPKEGAMPDDLAREVRHAYYACVSYVDSLVGGLLEELERTGQRENTIILLTSDHGYHLGDLSIWSKHTNFDLSAQVPLIVSVPGTPSVGKKTDAIVELVDIYPTLADLCGLPKPTHLQGRSFMQVLQDPQAEGRAGAFSEFTRGAKGNSIRTQRYRYTQWVNMKSGAIVAEELYDYQKQGPFEKQNLAANPEYKNVLTMMKAKLDARLAE